MEPKIRQELYRVMDALVALKIDLSCDPHIPGESLVLSATKARDACEALHSATASIKQLAAALNGEATGEGSKH
jgi:hypothetical protein